MRILDAPVFKGDGFEKPSTQPLNHCADDLIAQAVRIDDRAALERLHKPYHAHVAGYAIDRDLGTSGHVASLFRSARQAKSLPFLRLLARPAKGFCGSLQDGA